MALNERDFFTERAEKKPLMVSCQRCKHRAEYQITWLRRTKKERLPGGADERDRALFAKVKGHLVRVDDTVMCQKCRARIEIPSHQSLAFDDGRGELPLDEDGEPNFNR